MKMKIKMLMQLSWKGCSHTGVDGRQKVPPLTLNAYNVIKFNQTLLNVARLSRMYLGIIW